ncbi:hypothetical protein N9L92_01940 [Saprospiraceae bacterium]|nr:hypothetical protein [Saprospiraceae bacterium]
MKIKSVRLYELRIPFKFNITHTLKYRSRSYSIVVVIETAEGTLHYGEGCPREYVIDEPKENILKTFETIATEIDTDTFDSLENIKTLSDTLSDMYQVPSLASAFSIALLDMYSLRKSIPIYKLLNSNPSNHQLCPYSGILSTTDNQKFSELLAVIKKLELPHVKLKAGHAADLDNVRMARNILGDDIEIRIDGNRVWTEEEALQKIPFFYEYNITGVEEPLIASQIDRLPHLSEKIEIPIILDESIYRSNQAQYYIDRIDSAKLHFNLKISKLGGPLRAAEIFKLAERNKVKCMLGCNVGESAILSSIGRSFAQAYKLKHLEGSYAPFFMDGDIGEKPIFFGDRGTSNRITVSGLGLDISKKNMQAFSIEKSKIVK